MFHYFILNSTVLKEILPTLTTITGTPIGSGLVGAYIITNIYI